MLKMLKLTVVEYLDIYIYRERDQRVYYYLALFTLFDYQYNIMGMCHL